jgi:hypothetical protein
MGENMSKIIRTVRINSRDGLMTDAFAIAHRLEVIERQRAPTLGIARRRLADKLRIGLGSLENIVRQRVKRIDAEVKRRLDELLVRELNAEIFRLQNELEMARQSGEHPINGHVTEVETLLMRARALLSGAPQ